MISTIFVQELRALQQQLGADGDAGQNARRQLYNCTDQVLEAIREQCLGIPTGEVWACVDADPLTTPGEAESQLVAQKDAALGRLFAAIDHACGMAAIALDCRDEAAALRHQEEAAALLIEALTHCEARYGPFEICI